MIALYLQTILLLAVAYFAGAVIAWLIRRSLFRRSVKAAGERRVDPLPEYAQPAATAVTKPQARPPAPAVSAPAPAAAPAPKGPAQDLKRIRLIDAATEAALNRLGVTRYEEIAAWKQGDVRRIGEALQAKGRLNRENWIEQAQVLAKGAETAYSRRKARGEAATATPSPDEGYVSLAVSPSVASAITIRPQPSTGGAAAVVAQIIAPPLAVEPPAPAPRSPDVSDRAAFATAPRVAAAPAPSGPAPSPPDAVAIRPTPAAQRDNFLRIGQIDARIEKVLHDAGVVRYAHIAQWSPADVERFDKLLAAGGRISRENWIEQAQILSRGGDTAFSRQFDRTQSTKLADGLMDGAHVASPGLRTGALDDLKRIRGIGVLIEKKLNSMGISSYETIANWSAADIDRVSQSLDFKGRIERENWIEQARILASGGDTEFSRRVDRGEVETSRAKA